MDFSSDPAAEFLASSALEETSIETPAAFVAVMSVPTNTGFFAASNESDKISQWKVEESVRIANKGQVENY